LVFETFCISAQMPTLIGCMFLKNEKGTPQRQLCCSCVTS